MVSTAKIVLKIFRNEERRVRQERGERARGGSGGDEERHGVGLFQPDEERGEREGGDGEAQGSHGAGTTDCAGRDLGRKCALADQSAQKKGGARLPSMNSWQGSAEPRGARRKPFGRRLCIHTGQICRAPLIGLGPHGASTAPRDQRRASPQSCVARNIPHDFRSVSALRRPWPMARPRRTEPRSRSGNIDMTEIHLVYNIAGRLRRWTPVRHFL